MYLYHRIEELVATQSDARRSIGAFVLQEHAHLAEYTINDIAEATFTSKASVTRFAKALGYDGWRSFIRDFVREEGYDRAHENDVDPNFPFAEGDSDSLIAEKIGNLQAEAIADTFANLDRGMLGLAVRYLQESSRVWVFGIMPNAGEAELFCRKLLGVGKQASMVPYGEFGVVAQALTRDDCAIVVSYSGNNPTTNPMKQVPTLLASQAKIIGITSMGNNYIRQNIGCVLTISSRERLYTKIGTFATEESLAYIFNVLYACLFARDYKSNLQHKLAVSGRLEDMRHAVLKEIQD